MTAFPFSQSLSGLVETVKAIASGEQQPAVPRHAATVILVRDGINGPEAYMLRRQASMAFAPGVFVFPGGSVDARDKEIPDALWVGPPPAHWAEALASDEPLARALVCAAVRETFEESGVLLAGAGDGDVVADTSSDDWEVDRLALLDRSLSLAELLARRRLALRADLLGAWAHWITPEVENRRFDTRFFVAALPAGQRTRDVGGEADRVAWMRPADALAAQESGELAMMPPTIATLSDVRAFRTAAEVVAAAAGREVPVVMPKLVLAEGDRLRFLLPDDPDYPAADVAAPAS